MYVNSRVNTEGSDRNSLSDGSDRSSPMSSGAVYPNFTKVVPCMKMPNVERRGSKPAEGAKSAQPDPAVAFLSHPVTTVPFPAALSRWVDPLDCTVVDWGQAPFSAAPYIAEIKSLPSGPEVLYPVEDGRCMDLENCKACYPTEAVIRSALGEFAERPVCIHKSTKFLTKLRPWLGLFEVTWEGEKFFVYKTRVGEPKGTDRSVDFHESSMYIVPGRGRGVVLQRFFAALRVVHNRCLERPICEERAIRIYRWAHCHGCWDRKMTVKARSMDSVIIPKHHKDRIVKDLDRFFAKETAEWYEEHGLPYKRSLLFHGLPGTGKTSLITALAAKYERNVCFLQPQHPNFTDDLFKSCMEKIPSRAIVILEDVDSLFEGRLKTAGSACPLTFSGLLNALDGITYESGCIFVMTTNHVDRLDPALIRAGRCDIKIPFTVATDWQLARFFKKFYKDSSEEIQQLFVKNTRHRFPEGLTLAELQQHFIDKMFAPAEEAAEDILLYSSVKDEIASTTPKWSAVAKKTKASCRTRRM